MNGGNKDQGSNVVWWQTREIDMISLSCDHN